MRAHAAAKVNAVDDVAPLVRAAHLQVAAIALGQFGKVVGLQDHVVEFDEGELMLPLQTHLHRVHGQHAIDTEMLADISQHVDVVELRQPFGIVDHLGFGLARTEL